MNILDALTRRASVRSYSATALSKEEVETLLRAGGQAPVTHGRYTDFHVSAVLDPSLLRDIAAFYEDTLGMDLTYGAPALFVVSASDEVLVNQRFASAGCIVQNIQLAALELGLGAVFNWAAGADLPKRPDLLAAIGVPEGFVPLTGVVVGEPSDGRRTGELPERAAERGMGSNIVA